MLILRDVKCKNVTFYQPEKYQMGSTANISYKSQVKFFVLRIIDKTSLHPVKSNP